MIPAFLIAAYFLPGALFAIAFVARGIDRIDATPKTIGFRVIAFPGAIALWPVLLSRWIGAGL
jgi:hypothetical protein